MTQHFRLQNLSVEAALLCDSRESREPCACVPVPWRG
jgi:hypothetical protein